MSVSVTVGCVDVALRDFGACRSILRYIFMLVLLVHVPPLSNALRSPGKEDMEASSVIPGILQSVQVWFRLRAALHVDVAILTCVHSLMSLVH